MLFGVAGGMARYLDIDPSIVRIVWALLTIAGGAGLLLYIVAAVVIPEAPVGWEASTASGDQDRSGPAASATGASTSASASVASASAASGTSGGSGPAWGYRAGVDRRDRGGGAVILGLVLVGLGAWFLLQRFIPAIDGEVLWPVVLLVLGGALVIGSLRR
jgi:phage shock protein C